MRFRSIGRTMPGHPVLWLVALTLFALAAAWMAYDSTRVYEPGPDGNAAARVSWVGVILWGGIALYLAARTLRVLGVCIRMHARPFETQRHVLIHCPTCGYDLRATPTRCPECGRRF